VGSKRKEGFLGGLAHIGKPVRRHADGQELARIQAIEDRRERGWHRRVEGQFGLYGRDGKRNLLDPLAHLDDLDRPVVGCASMRRRSAQT